MSDTPVAITSELQKLSPSAIIELFELDGTSVGAEVLRFHAGTNGLVQDIVWQGQTYYRYPIEASGFEITGQGQIPRPRVKVSNYMSTITTYLLLYQDLIGSKVTRKRTLAKYLDNVNFPGSVNPTADATAEFADDVFYIDRKVSETRDVVEFELVSTLDMVGVQLPRRQIIQNLCTWKYRGPECGYTQGAIFDASDKRILTASTEAGQAVIDAGLAYDAAKAAWAAAERTLSSFSQNLNDASDLVLESDNFQMPLLKYYYSEPPAYFVRVSDDGSKIYEARFHSTNVNLGSIYRMGDFVLRTSAYSEYSSQIFRYHRIQKWHVDSTSVATAQASYNAAEVIRNARKADMDAAFAAYQIVLAALPANDPLFSIDRCGKRLSSCKLRFPDTDLPFGGFPGAGLFK